MLYLVYSQNACSFLCRSPVALTVGHCRQRYVVLLVELVPLLLLCMCPLTLLSLWSDWIRRVYPSVAGWRADSRRFLMCSGQPVSCASQCCDPHNILHPKVCAGAVGLFVSPTTEPLRVGVRVVADMVCGVWCVWQGRRRLLLGSNGSQTTHLPQHIRKTKTKGAFM